MKVDRKIVSSLVRGERCNVNNSIKFEIQMILNEVNSNGLKWKKGEDEKHLNKRIKKGHLSNDFTLNDYEKIILGIMNGKDNDVYIYYKRSFIRNYIVFGDGTWIAIIGNDAIMETSFVIDGDYSEYLSKEKGYEYLGKLKEVLR